MVYFSWNRRGNGLHGSVQDKSGPDEGGGFLQHLEAIAAQLGLNRKVIFKGALYGDAKWAVYGDADVFV